MVLETAAEIRLLDLHNVEVHSMDGMWQNVAKCGIFYEWGRKWRVGSGERVTRWQVDRVMS
jgi:hypothetical protein